jgi:hypothetical protein
VSWSRKRAWHTVVGDHCDEECCKEVLGEVGIAAPQGVARKAEAWDVMPQTPKP